MLTNQYCKLQTDRYKKCMEREHQKGGKGENCKEEHKQLLMCMSSFAFRKDLFEHRYQHPYFKHGSFGNNLPSRSFYTHNVPSQKNNH
jgi:hypothetical protein